MSDSRELFVVEYRGGRCPSSFPGVEGLLGVWPEPPYFYCFFGREVSREEIAGFGREYGWTFRDTYRLAYDQWQDVAPATLRVGPFLLHTPGTPPPHPERAEGMVLHLNPGIVFGSGVHPSTRGCLLVIGELFASFPIETVTDLGTGTGILALACARLGCRRVTAMDCNPLAAREALANVRLNRLTSVIHVVTADDPATLNRGGDLLLMNIEWAALRKVLEGTAWLRYGKVVLSGFLETQWGQVRDMLPAHYSIFCRRSVDGWGTVAVANPASGNTNPGGSGAREPPWESSRQRFGRGAGGRPEKTGDPSNKNPGQVEPAPGFVPTANGFVKSPRRDRLSGPLGSVLRRIPRP
ncbi:MAG TPA: 50S ribosomal protein L11 methyltransferase [Syntrophobacteraceae bacterium]|nr:50S ribosomal protein L11 methyltransferase [Syntrophobacteraceae bacterium]